MSIATRRAGWCEFTAYVGHAVDLHHEEPSLGGGYEHLLSQAPSRPTIPVATLSSIMEL